MSLNTQLGDVSSLDLQSARDEVLRLRRLVGPNEESYQDLQAELVRASDAVRAAEEETGEVRGELAVVNVELARARHAQGRVHRILLRRSRAFAGRIRRGISRRLSWRSTP